MKRSDSLSDKELNQLNAAIEAFKREEWKPGPPKDFVRTTDPSTISYLKLAKMMSSKRLSRDESAMIFAFGTVVDITTKFSVIMCGQSVWYVKWIGSIVPPGVSLGSEVGFYGCPFTWLLGRHAMVDSAIVIPHATGRTVKEGLHYLINRYGTSPDEYISEQQMEEMHDTYIEARENKDANA